MQEKTGLSVFKDSAFSVAGARLGLASEAYGASRKTFPNPPAICRRFARKQSAMKHRHILSFRAVNCQNKKLVP